MLGLLFFMFITFFLIMKLVEMLGMRVGFTIKNENLRDFSSDSKIKETTISKLDKKIEEIILYYPKFEESDFLKKARDAFEMIFVAYAKEDLKTLKNLLAPAIYNAFSKALEDRKSRRETLEGSIYRFISSEIIDAEITDTDLFVSVKFITDQSNVLKSKTGEILEGHSDFIETRTDIWSFSRKKTAHDNKWFLYQIKDNDD